MSATPNLRIKDNGDLVLKDVRLSYLFCFEPQENRNDNGSVTRRYKCTAILPKDTHAAEIEKLREILTERQKEKFKKRLPADRLCLRDGDTTEKEEYAGAYILVMSEREDNPPACLDRDGKTRLRKQDDKLYSGAFGNVMFRFWDQDNSTEKGGKRVNANFLGVQWLRHGDKFSSVNRPKEDEMFDDEGGEEDGGNDGFDE
ncbi:MAG TPA: ssDNA-binding protein [Pyrinomonadaceae bacterium]|jgi:hypothetical protein